jgi:hypothetical protein
MPWALDALTRREIALLEHASAQQRQVERVRGCGHKRMPRRKAVSVGGQASAGSKHIRPRDMNFWAMKFFTQIKKPHQMQNTINIHRGAGALWGCGQPRRAPVVKVI